MALRLILPLAVAASALAGCSQETKSSAAPPLIVCGQTLSDTPAGAVLSDASQPGVVEVDYETVGGYVFLQLTTDCSRGAAVTYAPNGSAQTVRQATTSDGKLAGVVLAPLRRTFDVTVTRSSGNLTTVHVRLPADARLEPTFGG